MTLVIVLVVGLLGAAIVVALLKSRTVPPQATTLSRPARAAHTCPHTNTEPVYVDGVMVSSICLNPSCGKEIR